MGWACGDGAGDCAAFDTGNDAGRRTAGWRAEFGEFARAELLGTGSIQGDPAVTVRLHFQRGGPTVQLVWGPRRLVGFRILPASTPVPLVAESPATWVYFSHRAPAPVRLTFSDSGALRIATPSGARTATREAR